MVDQSQLLPLREIRHNSKLAAQLKSSLVHLVDQATLDKGPCSRRETRLGAGNR